MLGERHEPLQVASYDWKCPKNVAKYQKIVEKRRLFKFLLGLNKHLDEVRGRIIGTKPLPTICEAFTEVKREETWKKLMLGKQTAIATTESSTLATRGYGFGDDDLFQVMDSGMMIGNAKVHEGLYLLQANNQSDWRKSIFDEMGALEKTGTWEIVDLLKDKNMIGFVKNAFLNGDLEEEVYMEIPLGFERNNDFKKVCKLRKALYGLKESTRARFDKFTKVIKKNGYIQCQFDHTLFVKFSKGGKITILIVYVDDIILIGDYDEEKVSLENLLTKEFEIKDLDDLKYFL
ncbi:Retrovirus-related Pol polyprotein from transposon TNT 1-94 [Vitis vinifera]|uniref:Retrovirus-related Pol polyprotein from transposon TNT 1-94 n=1 Tax=Vitis vinifera TaxID=29760 RepID=A0A438H291_VITVI|nr:Retrovirus-related Pol polyprotein from transposon TNT 1-94 [Vitis vinifera]